MNPKLQQLIKSHTFRQSAITVSSTFSNAVLATVFYLFVARTIGTSEYGVFSLVTATSSIMAVIFDFGNDRGMVKFIAKYGLTSAKAQNVLKAVFSVKVASCLFFITVFTLFSKDLALLLFHRAEMTQYIPLIGWAFASQLLVYFVIYSFQASEKFFLWALVFLGSNLVRLAAAFILDRMNLFNTTTALLDFIISPFLAFFIGTSYLGWSFITAKIDKSIFVELFSFNKWAMGFSTVSTVGSKLDTYMTSYYLRLSDVGVYGLASQAVLVLTNLVSAMGAVTSPKFSRFSNSQENSRYLLKSTIFFTIIAALSGLLLIPVGFAFMYISGSGYLQGFAPFIVLILSQAIFLAFTPLRDSILYYYFRPDFFFWVGIVSLVTTLVTGVLLLPTLGLMGAAVSNLSGQVVLCAFSVWFYFAKCKKQT